MRILLGVAAIVCASACTAPELAPASAPVIPSVEVRTPLKPLSFLEIAPEAAMQRARAEKKVLFVDVWAPWCHTCLSMKNFVLGDPALGKLGELAVFESLDFDKPESAEFIAKYQVKSLPTFLVVEPEHGEVLGAWVGSGSVREIRAMVETASAEHRGAATGADRDSARAFAEACRARARGDSAASAAQFRTALDKAPSGWALRDEALLGYLDALDHAGKYDECVTAAKERAHDLMGSSTPADVATTVLGCAEHVTNADEKAAAQKFGAGMLRGFIDHPPEGASVDDRGDASSTLADTLDEQGDKAGARNVRVAWLALLDDAVKKAPSVEAAHTFDYQRGNALVALGRADEAVTMLEERVKQFSDDYEPVARLAGVLVKAGRPPAALPVVRRAIALAYGPRKLRYIALEAKILGQLGDKAGAVEALTREVQGWQSLPPGQASPASLADATKRLEAARAATDNKAQGH